jgi:hypothetical protein
LAAAFQAEYEGSIPFTRSIQANCACAAVNADG